MPYIDCELHSFSRAYKKQAVVQADVPDLIHAAVTVGDPTLVSGGISRRPQMEMKWRSAMVLANLELSGRGWRRSASYDRLDPSEKSAVSYFLGMVQAKLTVGSVLRCSHMVHLDLVLKQAGLPLGKKRPDFLTLRAKRGRPGYNVVGVVEAKGRTNGFEPSTLVAAKKQAVLIPTLPHNAMTKSPMAVASVAYFDNDTDVWKSVLEDPVLDGEVIDTTAELSLIAYYRPVIEGLRDAWEVDGEELSAPVEGTPYRISIPKILVEAVDEARSDGYAGGEQFKETLSVLDYEQPGEDFINVRQTPGEDWEFDEDRIRLLGEVDSAGALPKVHEQGEDIS